MLPHSTSIYRAVAVPGISPNYDHPGDPFYFLDEVPRQLRQIITSPQEFVVAYFVAAATNLIRRPSYFFGENPIEYFVVPFDVIQSKTGLSEWDTHLALKRLAERRMLEQQPDGYCWVSGRLWAEQKAEELNSRTPAPTRVWPSNARKQLDRLITAYGPNCLACGGDEDLTVDHVIPKARGGKNRFANLQPLCMPCNAKKGTTSTDYRP